MRRFDLLLFFSLSFTSLLTVSAQMPVYDKSKHYQLRSMEVGPWEFHPPGWYYSWWTKDGKFLWIWDVKWRLPGLGLHDNGPAGIGIGGDNYVSHYKPNTVQRGIMLVQAKQVRQKYEEVTAKISEIHKRELANIADRTVDIVKQDVDPTFNKLSLLFSQRMLEYVRLRGRDETYTVLMLEKQKIEEAKEYMHSNYVRNADRQKAYSSQLKKLEELIVKVNHILKIEYAIQITEELK